MDQHRKFLETLKISESKKLFEIALDLILKKDSSTNPRLEKYKGMSHQEKIDVTKIVKFLNYAGFAVRKKNENGVDFYLNQSDKLTQKDKEFIHGILKMIEFDKTLNNYRLIVEQGKDTAAPWIERNPLQQLQSKFFQQYETVEWKIEVVLSSIAMKRVLKPVILLIIHTKQGRESFYIDISHFQELRKQFALILRQIHQVEFKP
mmetsp:Transcript_70271/g.81917  ORF Transcript_70271/g.81917 Transcript_70271/m.81917 type:complete len:205 (-) Transcript_70271:111-725(-)